ncbi:hypothetical protein BTUL_0409g00020 [Botrytis tulipae]|uniref:Uncharacterized protein n=1 Tax=Botrytis tulipae TaxID=87230 RepID=A0A4Z1E467_9HELO|nr:hypothetical protein BTUL_0409g00020 [Botrytis tulipae]
MRPQYFDSKDMTEAQSLCVPYSMDGIMELKEVKAIELQCNGGDLSWFDGHKVLSTSIDLSELGGKIVELRITHRPQDPFSKVVVHAIMPRPDKTRMNKEDACVSILSAAISKTRDPAMYSAGVVQLSVEQPFNIDFQKALRWQDNGRYWDRLRPIAKRITFYW